MLGEARVAGTVGARETGFFRDVLTIAGRSVRAIPHERSSLIPAFVIPVFWLAVSVGALEEVAGQLFADLDYRGFQLPVAILFAVTGVSRASALVTDINGGYFDRLAVSPVSRISLLLGLMAADWLLVTTLAVPVLGLGWLLGVEFATGWVGVVVLILIAGLWGVAFTGFLYAIALRTANSSAVASGLLLFFPFAFITTSFMPKEALTDWMATAATFNPVTYLLAALRALILEGWDLRTVGLGLAAVLVVGIVSLTLALAALRSRVDPT